MESTMTSAPKEVPMPTAPAHQPIEKKRAAEVLARLVNRKPRRAWTDKGLHGSGFSD